MKPSRPLTCLCLISVFIAVTAEAGINRWTSRGPSGGEVWQLEFSPTEPERAFAVVDGRLFRSDDAGRNWAPADRGREMAWSWRFLLNPFDSDDIITGTNGAGVLRSKDGGESWFRPHLWPVSYIERLAFDKSQPGRMMVHSRNGFWQTEDDGDSWSRLSDPPSSRPRALQLLDCGRFSRPLTITLDGVFLGSRDGESWQHLPGPWEEQGLYYPRILSTRGSGETALLASYEGNVYRSRDCATTWTKVALLPESSAYLRAALSNAEWIASGQQLYVSSDAGRSWQSRGSSPSRNFAVHETNPGRWLFSIGRSYENLWRSEDQGRTRQPSYEGLLMTMGPLAVDHGNPSILYGGGAVFGELWRSSNGGSSWTRLETGLQPPGASFYPGFTDVGTPFLQSGLVFANHTPNCPGVFGSCPPELVLRSDDFGESWQPVEGSGASYYSRFDSTVTTVLFDGGPHLVGSTDGGLNWQPISPPPIEESAPDQPYNNWQLLATDPVSDLLFAVSITEGLWSRPAQDGEWQNVAEFVPFRLATDPRTGNLYALTKVDGVQSLHESEDGGVTFHPVLDLGILPTTALARAHGDPDETITLAVRCRRVQQPEAQPTDCGLWQSDQSHPWRKIADRAGLTDDYWQRFVVDPHVGNTFWATASGVLRFDFWPGVLGLLDQWPNYDSAVTLESSADGRWVGDDFVVHEGEYLQLRSVVLWGRSLAGHLPSEPPELRFLLVDLQDGSVHESLRARLTQRRVAQTIAQLDTEQAAAMQRLLFDFDRMPNLRPGHYALVATIADGSTNSDFAIARGSFDPERGTPGLWITGRAGTVARAPIELDPDDGVAMQLLAREILTTWSFEAGNLD